MESLLTTKKIGIEHKIMEEKKSKRKEEGASTRLMIIGCLLAAVFAVSFCLRSPPSRVPLISKHTFNAGIEQCHAHGIHIIFLLLNDLVYSKLNALI